MKYKIILLMLLSISCQKENTVEITTEEYNKLKSSNYIKVNRNDYPIFNGSDGHTYIENRTYQKYYVITHSGNCGKCLQINDSIIKSIYHVKK